MPYVDMSIAMIFLGGGIYLGVKFHDNILKWWYGAEAFANMLQTKANAVKAVIK